MFGKAKVNRFETVHEEMIGSNTIKIIVDNETGVNYIQSIGAAFAGITPLLDSEGKVVVTK